MIQNRILYLTWSLVLILSLCSPKKNKTYASDFLSLNKVEFARKYFTLFATKDIDISDIQVNKVYMKYQNSDTFQIIVFSNDHYTYSSSLMPLTLLNKIPKQKLYRSDYFIVEKKILKLESVNVNIQSIIEEGVIEKDTIFIKKRYRATNTSKIYPIKIKYVLMPEILVYNFDDFIIIERK